MIVVGSVVHLEAGSKAGRTGVVLRVLDDARGTVAFVSWGTGTLRTGHKHVAVDPREPAGVMLALSKPTYFYPGNVWIGPVARLELRPKHCPPELLDALCGMFGIRR